MTDCERFQKMIAEFEKVTDIIDDVTTKTTCIVKFNYDLGLHKPTDEIMEAMKKFSWVGKWIRIQRIDGRPDPVHVRNITVYLRKMTQSLPVTDIAIWPPPQAPAAPPQAAQTYFGYDGRKVTSSGVSSDSSKPAYIEFEYDPFGWGHYYIGAVSIDLGIAPVVGSSIAIQIFDRDRTIVFQYFVKVGETKLRFDWPDKVSVNDMTMS